MTHPLLVTTYNIFNDLIDLQFYIISIWQLLVIVVYRTTHVSVCQAGQEKTSKQMDHQPLI